MRVWKAGHSSGRSLSFRLIICLLEGSSRQCFRGRSSRVGSEILSPGNSRRSDIAVYIQYDGIAIYIQYVAAYLNKEVCGVGVGVGEGTVMSTSLLAWCVKRHVFLVAKFVPGNLNVLADSLSRKGKYFIQRGLSTRARSISHEAQQSTSSFHISFLRPVGMSSGCDVLVMGGNNSICIPFYSSANEGPAANGERNLSGNPNSSSLGVVHSSRSCCL